MQNVNSNLTNWSNDLLSTNSSIKKKKRKNNRCKIKANEMNEVKKWLDSIIICVINQLVVDDSLDILESLESFQSKIFSRQISIKNRAAYFDTNNLSNNNNKHDNFLRFTSATIPLEHFDYPFTAPIKYEFTEKLNNLTRSMEESAKSCKQKLPQIPIYVSASGEFFVPFSNNDTPSIDDSLPPLVRPNSSFSTVVPVNPQKKRKLSKVTGLKKKEKKISDNKTILSELF
eukprot:TRINITY_DN1933_c0_g1_i1.p1 TRINITY_DN1933_c0_g1~~TRINITY_DN1933_c0_g1_i1.p1  ORF type:complete len:239 (-),score=53.19 TRINITY_DN1933_c0_g1_i1:49-738(-)